jgi:MFS transporter, ACS family, hexuronate transporter
LEDGLLTLFLQKPIILDFSRKLIMGIGATLTIPVFFIGWIPSYVPILIFITLAFFAHGLWITNYITSISDIYGKHNTSSIVGFSGTAGAISAMVLNPLTGYVVSAYSYDPLWYYAGIMYPVAFIFFIIYIPKIKLKESLKYENDAMVRIRMTMIAVKIILQFSMFEPG